MTQKIQIRRGLKANLPTLDVGELGFCTDTHEFFIGSSSGNILHPNQSYLNSYVKSINNTTPDSNGNITLPISNGGVSINDSNTSSSTTWSSNKISLQIASQSGNGVSGNINLELFQTEPAGELVTPPANYNAWTPNGVQFDHTRGYFVNLINGADQHVHTTITFYISTINPDKFVASTPKAITFPGVTPSNNNAATGFIIFDDGIYMTLINVAGVYHRFTSSDGGTTWIDAGAITTNPALASNANIWGIYKGSNGRLFVGFGSANAASIMYSDDKGGTWTYLTLTKTGGSCVEPCFIELSTNNLMVLFRKSSGGAADGTPSEGAMIGFSSDNGATWTQLKDSTTITKMNASDCAAIVHDGVVEVFTASRFYSTLDNVNTGKNGAIYQYTATISNAMNDNFTLKETVLYAKAASSVNFSSPGVAIDDKNRLLLVYMDESDSLGVGVSNQFVRGGLGYISYTIQDGAKSTLFGYSGNYIEKLLSVINTNIGTLQYQVNQLSSGGTTTGGGTGTIPPPSGTLIWTKQYNAQSSQVTLDKASAFIGASNFSNTAAGYDSLKTDINGITYNDLASSWAIAEVASQPNFAISFKGKIGNQFHMPVAAAIINGVGHGLWSVGDYVSDCQTAVHEYRLEFWNGTMKAYLDGNEITNKITQFTFDGSGVLNIGNFTSAIGTLDTTKNYAVTGGAGSDTYVYEVKYGEWAN